MDLKADIRESLGSGSAKALRKKGFIIGEVYGLGKSNVHVAVQAKEFAKAYKASGETSVITLHAGSEQVPVVMHDLARDYTGAMFHIDFRRVDMNETITASVPVEFIGESQAVKNGGVLVKAMAELEVEALPAHMPRSIVFDLSSLKETGESLHVSDAVLDKAVRVHVTLKADPSTVIATVIAQREEEEAVSRTMEDVKVETAEEKAKRDAEKAAKDPAK